MANSSNIIKKTLRGITKAHKDYEKWSDLWLWKAPEYMITTYIAKEIATLEPGYVYLERDAKKSIEEAGGVGQGKVSESTQRKLKRGRFDIVVWEGNTPIIIEVKNQPPNFSDKNKGIKGDVDNICTVLRGKNNSFKYGLIAYYAAWKTTEGESAEKRTSRIVKRIKYDAEAHINENKKGLKLRQYLSHTKPNAWIGVVLQISKIN